MSIPFGKYNNLPVTLQNDGVDKCSDFMNKSIDILNNAVYGMNDIKMQVLKLLGQWISNPNSIGSNLAIRGPMGTGKTTIVKDGISKILGREFAFIALGGATDSSFLEGHSYTYEGSIPGKIIDILIRTKTMNPIIYFDELDKISNTPKGDEITNILTHLTDTTQNHKFHDKYFSELDFDLSKAIFIFSYNDETKINPILKDRMFCVETKGYTSSDKIVISKDYLIPTIIKQLNMSKTDVIFNDDNIKYIIDNFTQKEKGVRNLKRCLENIYNTINLYRFVDPTNDLFKTELNINITFPIIMSFDSFIRLLS
jgi:ATP-dependent Lon protease